MRITLTSDDDVGGAARALAAQRGVPLGSIVSDLARCDLPSAQPAATRNGISLFPLRPGASLATPELVKSLAEEAD